MAYSICDRTKHLYNNIKQSGVKCVKLPLIIPKFWYATVTFISTCLLNFNFESEVTPKSLMVSTRWRDVPDKL